MYGNTANKKKFKRGGEVSDTTDEATAYENPLLATGIAAAFPCDMGKARDHVTGLVKYLDQLAMHMSSPTKLPFPTTPSTEVRRALEMFSRLFPVEYKTLQAELHKKYRAK